MLTDAAVKQACVSIPLGGVAEGFEPTSLKLVLKPIFSTPNHVPKPCRIQGSQLTLQHSNPRSRAGGLAIGIESFHAKHPEARDPYTRSTNPKGPSS